MMLENKAAVDFDKEWDALKNEKGRPNSLHTKKPKTGYQPYSQKKGNRQSSISPRSSSRSSSPAQSLVKIFIPEGRANNSDRSLRGTVAVTPSASQSNIPVQDAEPMHGRSGYARPVFTEAEQRIIAKGKEVATKAAEIERAEYVS